jgi:hypothetical protein
MISHRDALVLAATAIDFPLDASERAFLKAHVHECASCRLDVAAYQHDSARLAALPPMAPPAWVRGAIGRSRRPNRMVLLAAAALVLTAGAGVALVGAELRNARTPDVPPAPSTPAWSSAAPTAAAPIATVAASPVQAPSELRVTCDGTRTDIPTPLVKTQADGIHIQVANTSGQVLTFGIDGQFGGETIPAVGGTYVYTFGTGSYQLTCGGTASTFVVVDPDLLYTPAELLCDGQSSSTSDYGQGATGPRGSLLDIARMELRGLQPGDVIEHAGYPRSVGGQSVRVVRLGEAVAILGYADDGHGGWLIGGTRTCSGSNITTVSPAADCINRAPDIAALSHQTDPVACYGNASLTLDAYPVAVSVDCPVSVQPAWLGCPSGLLMLVGETRKVGAPFLMVVVDPASGVSLSAHFNTNVRISGHYDDPAAQTCRATVGSAALGSPEPAAGTVERCRGTFVVTGVVSLQS